MNNYNFKVIIIVLFSSYVYIFQGIIIYLFFYTRITQTHTTTIYYFMHWSYN